MLACPSDLPQGPVALHYGELEVNRTARLTQSRTEPVGLDHTGPSELSHLIRPLTLDRPKAEFFGFAQGDGLVTPSDFISLIGTLLPIAPCGRSSL